MASILMSGLQLGVFPALLIDALFLSDQLEKERHVVGLALIADTLGPGVLQVVDLWVVLNGVVQQDLHAVCARFRQALRRPQVQQIRLAARCPRFAPWFWALTWEYEDSWWPTAHPPERCVVITFLPERL